MTEYVTGIRAIYEHPLDEPGDSPRTLYLPEKHVFRHVGMINNVLHLYVEVDPVVCKQTPTERVIHIVGTSRLDIDPRWQYVGTAVNDKSVWHVYVEPLKEETE